MTTRRVGVRCDLTTRLTMPARERLQLLCREIGVPAESFAATHRVRLTSDGERHRIDFLTKGPFGTDLSIVHTREGAYWLQHAAKVYIALDAPRPPDMPAIPPLDLRGGARKGDTRQRPTAPPTEVAPPRLVDPATGQALRLTMTHQGEWHAPELAAPLLSALFGGPAGETIAGLDLAYWISQIAERGIPSLIRVEGIDPTGTEASLLSETAISDFLSAPIAERDFAPPKGYRPWSMKAKPPRDGGAGWSDTTGVSVHGSSVGRDFTRKPKDDDAPEPGTRPPRPPRPPAPSLTTQPRIALRIEQRLLTQITDLFNSAIAPIRTVSVGQGAVIFDWLMQLRNDVARRGADAEGTAIFRLLHDVALPRTNGRAVPMPPPDDDFGLFKVRGIVDQMAFRDAELRVRAGTYPTLIVQGLTPATRARITAAGTNWDALQDVDKSRLTFALLRREYGELRIPFPDRAPPGVAEFINFEVTGINGTLTLPPLPPATGSTRSQFNPLLMLSAGSGGTITGSLSIGTLGITATVARWPGATYWAIVGGGVLAAILFPGLAWLIPLIVGVTTFLAMDVVDASITTSPLAASLTVAFEQDANGVFFPRASCAITGTATFSWASRVPTGIHQILALIEESIMNALSGTMINALATGIADGLTAAARTALGGGFPATATRLALPIAGGRTGGIAGSYTYLEAALDLPRDARFQIAAIQTPTPLERAQQGDVARAALTSFDHYGSLSMDQNFVNATLIAMRLRGLFDVNWPNGMIAALKPLIPAPLPRASVTSMRLVADHGPTFTLDTQHANGIANHGRLSLEYELSLYKLGGRRVGTVRFRVDTTAQLLLGNATQNGVGFVRILSIPDRAFDVLIDLAGATVVPISCDLVSTVTTTTETIEFDDRGKPRKVIETDVTEVASSVPVTGTLGAALSPLLRAAVTASLASRAFSRAPRRDGTPAIAGVSPDPVTRLRYPLGDQDPDQLLSTVPSVGVEMGLERGLAHLHLGLAGPLGLAFIPTSRGVPTLATLNADFSEGLLAFMVARKSSRDDRPLQL